MRDVFYRDFDENFTFYEKKTEKKVVPRLSSFVECKKVEKLNLIWQTFVCKHIKVVCDVDAYKNLYELTSKHDAEQ